MPFDKDTKFQNANTDLASGLLKSIGLVLLLDLIALVLGFSFFMIVHGSIMGIFRLAPYWSVANSLFFRATGKQEEIIPLRGIHVFRFMLWLVVNLSFVALGVFLMFRTGFCGQNLVCLFNR